jgi:dCMP deaminase
MTWDEFFMKFAFLAAQKSKDTSSQIGAVIVKDNRVISIGYNGICQGVNDPNDLKEFAEAERRRLSAANFAKTYIAKILKRNERPEKYLWFEHAERNAIYSAARAGISTLDSIMYTNGTPCCDCARAIIQAGLSEVVVHSHYNKTNSEKWSDHAERSEVMFREAGVGLREIDAKLDMKILRNGKVLKV